MLNYTKLATSIARPQGGIVEIVPATAGAMARPATENRPEQQQLVRLTAMNQRLVQAAGRGEALDTIEDIIINVVGCAEYAILRADDDGVGLELVASLGIDAARLAGPSAGVIAEVVESGTAFFAPTRRTLAGPVTRSDDASVTACVPLCASGGRIVGAIALYQLLPHKPSLDQLDRSLLALLSVEAARSLLSEPRRMSA